MAVPLIHHLLAVEPLAQGADLIIFSGGKGIRGPQATGLVLGRQGLIEACRLNASPFSAIGRPMKVGKEDVAALVAALEVFMAQDEEAEMRAYARRADQIVAALDGVQGITARTLMADPRGRPLVPRVYIDFQVGFPLSGRQVRERMLAGEPLIAIGDLGQGIMVNVMLLEEWEVRAVAHKLGQVLGAEGV